MFAVVLETIHTKGWPLDIFFGGVGVLYFWNAGMQIMKEAKPPAEET